jgi:hypothetical protein
MTLVDGPADRTLESMHSTLTQELGRIARRVQAARPDVPPSEVEAAVARAAARYAHARVEHFLPILVERAACTALDDRGR